MNARRLAVAAALVTLSAFGVHAAGWPGEHFHRSLSLTLVAEDTPPRAASDATAPGSEEKDRQYLGNEPLESCMNRWDPGTHMTKEAWRDSCKRITEERAPYVKNR